MATNILKKNNTPSKMYHQILNLFSNRVMISDISYFKI